MQIINKLQPIYSNNKNALGAIHRYLHGIVVRIGQEFDKKIKSNHTEEIIETKLSGIMPSFINWFICSIKKQQYQIA
jgi:hypothetical protein